MARASSRGCFYFFTRDALKIKIKQQQDAVFPHMQVHPDDTGKNRKIRRPGKSKDNGTETSDGKS